MNEPLTIIPERWAHEPEHGGAEWVREHAPGLCRVWPAAPETVERVAREVGVSWKLLVTRMEVEQSAISYAWDGTRLDYPASGSGHVSDQTKLRYLCGVDKTDDGPRRDGWFGPELQLYGCAVRFRFLYRGEPIPAELAAMLPALPHEVAGLAPDPRYRPNVGVSRGGETIVPANQASADCLRYTTSLAGSRRLARLGRQRFPEDYETPAEPENGGQTMSGKVICLDPGHGTMLPKGGRDSGTNTTHGSPVIYEKDANLSIVRRMRTLLEAEGHRVLVTHERSDYAETMSYGDRGCVAVKHGADVFVSVHHDGIDGTNDKVRGTHGFAHRTTYPNGMKLARLLAEASHEEFGVPYSYGSEAGDWFGKNLGVLTGCGNADRTEAAGLVEMMFMAGGAAVSLDVAIIRSPGYYDRAARALCRAIHRYLGLAIPDDWAPGNAEPHEHQGDDQPEEGLGVVYVSRGDRGAAVLKVQQALNRHGAAIDEDGDFGGQTWAAVTAFQRANDLVDDGVVGPLTWAKLGA